MFAHRLVSYNLRSVDLNRHQQSTNLLACKMILSNPVPQSHVGNIRPVNIFCIFTSSKDTLFRAIGVSSAMKNTLQVLFTGNLHKNTLSEIILSNVYYFHVKHADCS